jgi:hypothetical protein
MTTICYVDTETTSLRHDRRAWEIAVIVRAPGKPDVEHSWFVDSGDLDLGSADLMSLKIGRFYERHPDLLFQSNPHGCIPDVTRCRSEREVMGHVERITRGAHLVGAVPNFDADVLGARMRAHGICPSWHYHLCDVENLAVGYLAGRGEVIAPPWKSDDLAAALGLSVSEDERHTALGDARFARAIYDAVMGGAR